MRGMYITRLVILLLTSLFALIVLAVNAAYLGITFTAKVDDAFGLRLWPATSPDPFAVVNIFVGVLSSVLVKPMLIIDFCRTGAFTSMIMTELIVLGIVNIFWLVSAAYTTNIWSNSSDFCSLNSDISSVSSACTDIQVSLAFSWLNWIMVLCYFATLLTFSIIYSNRGMPIWKKSVRIASTSTAKPIAHGKPVDYAAPSLTGASPLIQAAAVVEMQRQPVMQPYGGTLYPPQPTGMPYAGSSPLRAEV